MASGTCLIFEEKVLQLRRVPETPATRELCRKEESFFCLLMHWWHCKAIPSAATCRVCTCLEGMQRGQGHHINNHTLCLFPRCCLFRVPVQGRLRSLYWHLRAGQLCGPGRSPLLQVCVLSAWPHSESPGRPAAGSIAALWPWCSPRQEHSQIQVQDLPAGSLLCSAGPFCINAHSSA